MNATEFIYQFDILYNNISSNQSPGLDDYEKSVFLTKAQEEILKSYFNPKLNKIMEGFESGLKRHIDFSTVVCTKTIPCEVLESATSGKFTAEWDFDEDDALVIVNEFLHIENTNNRITRKLTVVPISYIEWSMYNNKPFVRPAKNKAWRIVTGNKTVTIIAHAGDILKEGSYEIRYIRKPYPIILTDLSQEGLTINGKDTPFSTTQCCELDESLHEEILQRAVELAKASFGSLSDIISVGNNSSTELGILGAQSKDK